MAKSQWQPTDGVIVNVEKAFGHHEQKYTIEVRKWNGSLIQYAVKHKTWPPYDVGTRVKVQISTDDEIRFDPDHPGEMAIISTMDMSDQIAEASAAFGRGGIGPTFGADSKPAFGSMAQVRGAEAVSFVVTTATGTPITVRGGSIAAAVLALSMTPGGTLQMVGPTGLSVDVDPAEIKGLAHTMRSSDPAEKKAAVDRWHQLREAALGNDPGGSSSPAAAQSGNSVENRLALLDKLHTKGMLTGDEYNKERLRIISEL